MFGVMLQSWLFCACLLLVFCVYFWFWGLLDLVGWDSFLFFLRYRLSFVMGTWDPVGWKFGLLGGGLEDWLRFQSGPICLLGLPM